MRGRAARSESFEIARQSSIAPSSVSFAATFSHKGKRNAVMTVEDYPNRLMAAFSGLAASK